MSDKPLESRCFCGRWAWSACRETAQMYRTRSQSRTCVAEARRPAVANTMSDREGPARGSQIRIHQASTIAVKHVIWKSIVRDHVIELASRLVVPAAPTRRCVDADNCTLIDAREKTLRIVPIDPEQLEIVAYAISRRSSHCHRRKRQPLPSMASATA